MNAVLLRTVEGYSAKAAMLTGAEEAPAPEWTPPNRTLH